MDKIKRLFGVYLSLFFNRSNGRAREAVFKPQLDDLYRFEDSKLTLGQQRGFTKYSCYRDHHWIKYDWSPRP